MTRYISFKDVARLDGPAHELALQMARRFYWFHKTNPGAKSRFNRIDGSKALHSYRDAAYEAYRHYYQQLSLELGRPQKDAIQLENIICDMANNDRSLDDVLQPPKGESSEGMTSLKHMHEIVQATDQRGKCIAMQAYQQALRYRFDESYAADDKLETKTRIARQQSLLEKASAISYETYRDYHASLHKAYMRTPPVQAYELNLAMKQRQLQQQKNAQAMRSAWNAGYKLGTVIAYCASLLPYVYYKARYGRDKGEWQVKRETCRETRLSWAKNVSRVVGTVFAAISFTTLVLPAMLIQHKTRRPSLSSDDTSLHIYRIYDQITDKKGQIKPEYQQYARQLIRQVLHSYDGNRFTGSQSSKKLIGQLKSDVLTDTEKLQAMIGYMTTNNTTQSALKTAANVFWSRDQRSNSSDAPHLLHNHGKRLYHVIESALLNLKPTATSTYAEPRKGRSRCRSSHAMTQPLRMRH